MNYNEKFLENLKHYETNPEYVLNSLLFELNEQICAKLEEKRISNTEFAEMLGVKLPRVSKILNGMPNLSLKTVVNIALALNMKIKLNLFEEDVSKEEVCFSAEKMNSDIHGFLDSLSSRFGYVGEFAAELRADVKRDEGEVEDETNCAAAA